MERFRLTREGGGSYSIQLEKGMQTSRRKVLFASSLPLSRHIREALSRVSARLSSFDHADFSGKELFAPATYALKRPGKMLRPALVLLGAELIEADTDEFVDMAAAAELLHTASLVHDDMVDKDTIRRGAPTLHVRYDQETALLVGDALIAKSVAMAAGYGPDVMKRVAKASLDMCAGELLDYTLCKDGRMPGVRDYLKIARLKSGVFLGVCASIAATYKRKARRAQQLYGFGLSLGVAFQIRDDIIEFVDASERRRNGGNKNADSSNLVRIFARQFGVGAQEALGKAVGLNNYFADRALQFIQGEKRKDELAAYIDFVRVRDR